MSTASPNTRVVVADDSALMRRIVSNLLARGGVDVVGAACDGDEALTLCERERPDVMTLDLAMPGLGGIEVLRELRRRGLRLPVVVVSAFSATQGARAVDALAEGAFELVPKPTGADDVSHFQDCLLSKIKLATAVVRRGSRGEQAVPSPTGAPAVRGVARVLLIATSTGGPRALSKVIPSLPARVGIGTLIVQHMPAGFTGSLAARLDRASALTVREAHGGEALSPHVALVAPGGRHLRLDATGRTMLSDDAPDGGLRPRADLLIEDAATTWGERLTLVVLTGMGNDGLRGAQAVRRHGGRVIAESQSTCTVYGMPRAVVEARLADAVVPIDRMADAIAAEVGP